MIIDDKMTVKELQSWIKRRLYIRGGGTTYTSYQILEILIDGKGVSVLIPGGTWIRLDRDSIDLDEATLLNRIKQGLLSDVNEIDKELAGLEEADDDYVVGEI